jgi:hypothetical protein
VAGQGSISARAIRDGNAQGRKDGHHRIIFMPCGPVRHRVDADIQNDTIRTVEGSVANFRVAAAWHRIGGDGLME